MKNNEINTQPNRDMQIAQTVDDRYAAFGIVKRSPSANHPTTEIN